MEFVEVTSQIEEPRFLDLLSLAVGYPTPEKLALVVAGYRSLPGRKVFALLDGQVVQGIIGLEPSSRALARVRHIAVPEALRRQGIGRRLLTEACAATGFTALVAETHRDAVGFYRACGFSVQSLGERFPGVERFSCALGAA
jgi:ribosomal protein S18 acetylase RimI-like enzyme